MLSALRKTWVAISVLCLVAYSDGAGALGQQAETTSRPSSETSSTDATESGTQNPIVPLDARPTGTSGPAERVQHVGPETYILRDAQGRPQAMPGMTYEDFLAAWKRLQQVDGGERRPRFSIE